MNSLTMLRRLAEQHNYAALQEACLTEEAGSADMEVLLALAQAHLGDSASAARTLTTLDVDALDPAARVDLAAVHMALGDIVTATTILQRCRQEVERAPDATPRLETALLFARLAWCQLQNAKLEQALRSYERSLALQPLLAVYQGLTRLYLEQGQLREADRCLDEAHQFWMVEQTHWPEARRESHSRALRGLRLDLWLAEGRLETAESWVEAQQTDLGQQDWCTLVADLAERLAAHDRYAQAEEWLHAALRRHPDHLAFYTQLADLAQTQGRALQATAILHRGIREAQARDEPSEALWTRLLTAVLPASLQLARQAIERARELAAERCASQTHRPDDVSELALQIEVTTAEVEVHERSFQAAEKRYRQVVAQRPDNASALHGLGQLLLQLGRLDEAVALFERVTRIDPIRGHRALFHAHQFPQDEEELRRLEALARRSEVKGSMRTTMLFALAAAWERLHDYDKAFELADEANAASRPSLRYDPVRHRQYCARIRHAFPRALFEHRPDCGHPTTLPVFIVGMPRSGTTLVEQIIAGHSRVHGAGELGVIPRVIAGLERWERHTGSGRHYPDCVDDLDPAVIHGIAARVVGELRHYAPEADHVVDKLPHNFENVGLIRLLFPRAKIISVRRDPRDIAISNYLLDFAGKHGTMGFTYHLDWIGEQLADHNLLMHHWHQIWPEEILEVHYEDIVDDPEANARRLLDHIGVPWEPQVLDFDALERPIRTASVWQVRQPLYASAKARWQPYRHRLAPLIIATNRKVRWDPIEMITLPQPGLLNAGVDLYRQGDLDAAELRFKKLLHHVPEHAAARFMLGLVYVRKGHREEGIELMEHALDRCPWNPHWRRDLANAYVLAGRHGDAGTLNRAGAGQGYHPDEAHMDGSPDAQLDYLFLSEENTCASPGPARSDNHC